MKSHHLALAAVVFCAALRLVAAPVESFIAAVTVYTDRAVVTRAATVELSGGTAELVFANLPQSLDERSLQVSGRGTAQALILDVSTRQTYVDFTPNARVKELEDQLKALGKQVRALDDRRSVLAAQTEMLSQMEKALFAPPSKEVPRPDLGQLTSSLTYLSEQRSRIIAENTALDEGREELRVKIQTVQSQLNELRGAGGRAYKTVTVRVAAAQSGNLEVSLSYTVPNASWVPSYDARVLSTERAVAFGYFGVVRQSTGEDWQNVAVTLSTARPGLGGAAPSLTPWQLDLWREEVVRLERFQMSAPGARAKVADAQYAVQMQMMTSEAAPPMREAEMAVASVEAGATSASFKIATAATIPSDGTAQKVPITAAKFAANPEYLTVPKRQQTAFLTAKVVNTSEFPLLAGAMNVFLDGTFVATSSLRSVMAGEKFDLALGADEGISVKHKRVQKFTENTGLMNTGKRITYEYLITVQNNKRTAERVIVVDQVPLSRNEKITVKLLSPDAREVKPTDEGSLKWTLDLKPGEKRELTVKFAVEHANDVNVSGLE
ncbi:MAG: mucoidy inhibitor MuiA family protein [Candidatus Didemnitutus sp.]|nr:mucoidy inhibitor MuiA family protein [Candidatus Didemnitutus sp.]